MWKGKRKQQGHRLPIQPIVPLSYSCTRGFSHCRNAWLTDNLDNLNLLHSPYSPRALSAFETHAVNLFRLSSSSFFSFRLAIQLNNVCPLLPNKTRGPSLIICQWITVSIASFLIFRKIYTRTFLRKTAGADDGTMVTALVSSSHSEDDLPGQLPANSVIQSFAAAQRSILTIFSGRQWVWKAYRVITA